MKHEETLKNLFMRLGIQQMTAFIDLTGDHFSAMLLKQIIYWSDRTQDPDGWIAKTYNDWYDELRLKEKQVRRAADNLRAFGLEIKRKKSPFYDWQPVLHYRLNWDVLIGKIIETFAKSAGSETAEYAVSESTEYAGSMEPAESAGSYNRDYSDNTTENIFTLKHAQNDAANGGGDGVPKTRHERGSEGKTKFPLNDPTLPRICGALANLFPDLKITQKQLEKLSKPVMAKNGLEYYSPQVMFEKYPVRFLGWIRTIPEMMKKHETRINMTNVLNRLRGYDWKYVGYFDWLRWNTTELPKAIGGVIREVDEMPQYREIPLGSEEAKRMFKSWD